MNSLSLKTEFYQKIDLLGELGLLEVNEMLKVYLKNRNKLVCRSASPKFDSNKFCGTVKFQEDGLEIQKKLCDEWR